MSRVAGSLDVGLPKVGSLAGAVAAVRERAGRTPLGDWIVGDGWAESKWIVYEAEPRLVLVARTGDEGER